MAPTTPALQDLSRSLRPLVQQLDRAATLVEAVAGLETRAAELEKKVAGMLVDLGQAAAQLDERRTEQATAEQALETAHAENARSRAACEKECQDRRARADQEIAAAKAEWEKGADALRQEFEARRREFDRDLGQMRTQAQAEFVKLDTERKWRESERAKLEAEVVQLEEKRRTLRRELLGEDQT